MVEPLFDTDIVLREATPTPQSRWESRKDFYDILPSFAPRTPSPSTPSQDSSTLRESVQPATEGLGPEFISGGGDRQESMSDSSFPGRTGPNRRRSHARSGSNNLRRPPAPPHQPSPSSTSLSLNASLESSALSAPPPYAGPSSSHYRSPPPAPALPTQPHVAQSSYFGQYNILPHQPMPNTTPPFVYPHQYGHHLTPDGSRVPHNRSAGFQPYPPMYPYQLQPPQRRQQQQPHSPDGSGAPYGSNSPSSVYGHPSVEPSPPPPPSPLSGQPSQAGPSSPYSAGQYHPMHYASPMSSSPYGYHPTSFPTSPIYPQQYMTPGYGTPAQHYIQPEQEGAGAWWYLPATTIPPPAQYESQPSYYPVSYPTQATHLELEAPYLRSAAGASPSDVAESYLITAPQIQSQSQSGSSSEYGLAPPLPSPSSSPSGIGPTPPSQSQGPKPEVSSSSRGGGGAQAKASDRPVIRRHYHPNPPTHRSEWVMWVGNVPPDATREELWRFFNQPPSPKSQPVSLSSTPVTDHPLIDGVGIVNLVRGAGDLNSSVVSIFVISRSSCAFINFQTEADLHRAIERYNGQPLRPNDPRCPRLVCRVRKQDDDLKAGVGAQRGMGMHSRWIKEQKGKVREMAGVDGDIKEGSSSEYDPSTSSSSSGQLVAQVGSMSLSSDDEGRPQLGTSKAKSGSSGSYASTTSSFLIRHFPKRYFILKSLTQFDLDLSVEKGLWATQRHNEGILDQAFRTSTDVYLIFSVNKSGEFYGYARMAGPILQGKHKVSWATRTADSSSSRSSPAAGRGSFHSDSIPEEPQSPSRSPRITSAGQTYFPMTEHRMVDDSPLPVPTPEHRRGAPPPPPSSSRLKVEDSQTPIAQLAPEQQSAPAILGRSHTKWSTRTPKINYSLDPATLLARNREIADDFELDEEAPVRAIRSNRRSIDGEEGSGGSLGSVPEEEESSDAPDEPLAQEQEQEADKMPSNHPSIQPEIDGTREDTWGESFKIEWVCTDRLPFYRTRHIRNPWNHDREVKVSRDGTELEPAAGQQLLDEWAHLSSQPLPPTAPAPFNRSTSAPAPRRGGMPRP